MCNAVFSFLGSIPDVIWSGIIASCLTLSGVLISNRSNTTRLKLQLRHDATEKAKERTAALRRNVYLRTVEELVKANTHLANLPQLDVTKVNLGDGLQGFISAASRLQLVAEPKTALLVNELSAEYVELVFSLMAHLMPVSKAKSEIRIADNFYLDSQVEVKRILGEMDRLRESGNSEPPAFKALYSNFDFHFKQSEEFAAKRSDAWTRFNTANISYQKFLFTRLRDLVPKQIPVMVEIRRDLGLIGSLGEVEAQLQQQMQRMEKQLDALIASLHDG